MQHKWKRLISYYRPYRGLFFSDMVFAILGAAVTLAISTALLAASWILLLAQNRQIDLASPMATCSFADNRVSYIHGLGSFWRSVLYCGAFAFLGGMVRFLSIGTTALRIIGTHFLIAGINVVAMSVYQAVGDPLYSLLSSVTRQLVVLLPAAWLLARTGRLELVWLAFPIAELAALAMSAIFLRKTLRTAECRMADDDYGEVV